MRRLDWATTTMVVGALLLTIPVQGEQLEPSAHSEALCGDCHGVAASPSGLPRTDKACRECHANDGVGVGSTVFHGEGSAACSKCHLFHAPTTIVMGTTQASTASSGRAARTRGLEACSGCHRPLHDPREIHPGHVAAATWYHRNVANVVAMSPSASCLRCHERGVDLPDEIPDIFRPPAMHTSASHPYGVTIRSKAGGTFDLHPPTDPRMVLVNERIECTTCHDLYNLESNQLVHFENAYDMCVQCHERAPGPGSDQNPSRDTLAR